MSFTRTVSETLEHEIRKGEILNWKKAEKEEPAYLIRERRFSQFRRSFTLPSDINEEKISADFKNGVLRVRIPRKTELLPHKIQIKSA